MLLLRVITALILAPLVIGLTVWLPSVWFAVFLAVILLSALREWGQLVASSRLHFGLSAVALLLTMAFIYQYTQLLYGVTLVGSVYWLVQTGTISKGRSDTSTNYSYPMLQAFVVLLAAWSSLVLVHQVLPGGPLMTIGLLFIVWSADSFAYFAGKHFGRNKLAPQISPGKTVEGVIGGSLGAVVFSLLVAAVLLTLSNAELFLWAVCGLIAALVSVVGDLYESRLKRQAGVKDSGSLLPGHGGVLDRIDGLLAASPVFVALWWQIL